MSRLPYFSILFGLTGNLLFIQPAFSLGFKFKESTLPIQTLEVQPNGRITGAALRDNFYLAREKKTARYFFDYGIGLPQYGIADFPGVTVWEVIPGNGCATLKVFPVEDFKALSTEAMARPENDPLHREPCSDIDDSGKCTSRDNLLRFTTRFEGIKKIKKMPGGWSGAEDPIDVPFSTGQRIFTVEHIPSGLTAVFTERLKNDSGYTDARRRLAYLPELGIVMFFGLTDDNDNYISYCIKLPEAPTP